MADGQRPESALDRALAALDAGLQHSTEGGETLGDLTKCSRCLREPRATESEFCPRCRRYLLREELDVPVDVDDCGNPDCPVHGDGSAELELVLLTPSGPVTGAPEVTADDFARITALVEELAPVFEAFGRTAAATVVQFTRLVPPELLEVSARLEEVVVEGQALGLAEDRCVAVVDEEIERSRQTLEALHGLPDRVRGRLYHEGGACACVRGVQVCEWAGRSPTQPVWREEGPCA